MTDRLPPRLLNDAAGFGRVAVLFGGTSGEREISLQSGKAVYDALCAAGIDAVAIDAGADVIERLQGGNFDRVFIMLHGRGGEDGVIQGVLETLHLPYTGSGLSASAVAMDKLLSKHVWTGLGLPTPRCAELSGDDLQQTVADLGLPVIIKPVSEGSSLGMSKVTDYSQLAGAWQQASATECRVMAEQWVQGREITASVLGDTVLPLIHVETPHELYDFDAKYRADTTRYHCPSGLDEELESQLKQLAGRAFAALGCSGWGRVDMMLDSLDQPWLIEANTVPGMTGHSLVPMSAKAAGIDFAELVWRILETSFTRSPLMGATA